MALIVSVISLDGTTGTISKSIRSCHRIIHCWKSRGSSHSISWKQQSKFASTQLSTYFKPSGSIRPCSRKRLYTARAFLFLNLSITMKSIRIHNATFLAWTNQFYARGYTFLVSAYTPAVDLLSIITSYEISISGVSNYAYHNTALIRTTRR